MACGTGVSIQVMVLVFGCAWCQQASDLVKLFDDKIWPGNPYIRPVLNQSDCLNISIRLNIVAITDFNEVQEKLSFTAWLKVIWIDELISWDPDQYGGVDYTLIPLNEIWHPNIAVANTMSSFSPFLDSTDMAAVFSDGRVEWHPGTTFDVYCEVDTTNFPFDNQACVTELLVWDYRLSEVDLQPMEDTIGTSSLMPNGEWTVLSTSVSREVKYPDGQKPIAKPFVKAILTIKRRPQFVLVNIILPTALLTILNSFVFLIPVDSGEKIGFSVTILLAYGVLMSFITDMLPKTSKTTSRLSVYMVTSLMFSSCFVMMAILITRLHRKNEAEHPVPGFVAHVTKRMEFFLCRRGGARQSIGVQMSVNGFENQSNVIVNKQSALNGILQPRSHHVTWKRVASCLDLTLFLIFFPMITIASIVIMLNDFISSQVPNIQ